MGTSTREALKAQFNAEMESIFEREREIGLCSTRFIESVRRHGGVAYAHILLKEAVGDTENRFGFLREHGRLDLTMEYYVVQERFRSLFDDKERQVAQWRLDHAV